MKAEYLTVRVGSTFLGSGGTVHNVTGGYYHGSYNNQSYNGYDVAILRVCTDFDIPIDISKFVMCL